MLVLKFPLDYFPLPHFFSRSRNLDSEGYFFYKSRYWDLKKVFADAFLSAWSTQRNLASNFFQKVIFITMWTSCEQLHLARSKEKPDC